MKINCSLGRAIGMGISDIMSSIWNIGYYIGELDLDGKVSDFSRKHLHKPINRFMGKLPKTVVVTRDKDDSDGNIVYRFSNVSIVDFYVLAKETLDDAISRDSMHVEQGEARDSAAEPKSVLKIDYASESLEFSKFLQEVRLGLGDEQPFGNNLYELRLVIKKSSVTDINRQMRLAEVDYGNWGDASLFEVMVFEQGSKKEAEEQVKEKVIETLRNYTKLTNDTRLSPVSKIDEIAVASSLPMVGTVVNYFKGFTGVVEQRFNLDEAQSAHARKNEYISELIDLAIAKAEADKESAIISNYCGACEVGLLNERRINRLIQKELVTKRLKQHKRFLLKKVLVIAGIALAAIVVLSTVMALFVLFAPAGVVSVVLLTLTYIATTLYMLASGVVNGLSGALKFALSLAGIGVLLGGGFFMKALFDYNATKHKNDKNKLANFKAEEAAINKELNEINESSIGANNALKALAKLNINLGDNSIPLVLNLSKVALKEVNAKSSWIKDAGMSVIYRFLKGDRLMDDGSKSPANVWCSELNVANSGISDIGAKLIAELLRQDATTKGINKLNITGPVADADSDRGISEQGISEVLDALAVNFTITEFEYGKDGSGSGIAEGVKSGISQQIWVNRYIQGMVDFGNVNTVMAISRAFIIDSADSFQQKVEQALIAQMWLKAKNRYNFDSLFVPDDKGHPDEVIKLLKQNSKFMDLENSNGNYDQPHLDLLFEAYLINPVRYGEWIDSLEGNNSSRVMVIRKLVIEKGVDLLKKLGRSNENEKEFKSFLLATMSLSRRGSASSSARLMSAAMFKVDEPHQAILKDWFSSSLRMLSDVKAVVDGLKKLRKDVATGVKQGIDQASREKFLLDLDQAILGIRGDSEKSAWNKSNLNRYRLERSLIERPSDPNQALSEFLKIFKELSVDEGVPLTLALDAISSEEAKNGFIEMLIRSKYDATLASFVADHTFAKNKTILLNWCFEGRNDKDELSMVANEILSNQELAKLYFNRKGQQHAAGFVNTLDQYFTGERTSWWSDRIVNVNDLIAEGRKAAINAANAGDFKQAALIELPLQRIEQFRVKEIIKAAFAKSAVRGIDYYEKLKKKLICNNQLTVFELVEQEERYSPRLLELLDQIVERNRLNYVLNSTCSNEQKAGEFYKIYNSITIKDLPLVLAGIDLAKLEELIKDDIYNLSTGSGIFELIKENDCRLRILLEKVLGDSYQEVGIASLVVGLLKTYQDYRGLLDSTGVFNRRVTDHWSYDDYCRQLSLLIADRNTVPQFAKALNEALQKSLQDSLVAQCSSGSRLADLLSNKYLTDWNEELEKKLLSCTATQTIAALKLLCKANKLEQVLASNDFGSLKKYCEENKDLLIGICRYLRYRDEQYGGLKLKLLNLIKNDLGTDTNLSCDWLRSLNNSSPCALQALLGHCFSISDKDYHQKALLISNLLSLDGLMNATDKLSQLIKYEIYWAISPGSFSSRDHAYYDFNTMINRLNEVVKDNNSDQAKKVKQAISQVQELEAGYSKVNPDEVKITKKPIVEHSVDHRSSAS